MFIGIGMNLVRGGGNAIPYTSWFLASGAFDLAGIWLDAIPYPIQWFLQDGTFDTLGIWEDSRSYP